MRSIFIAVILTIISAPAFAQNWNNILNQAIQNETRYQTQQAVPQASGVVDTGQLLNGNVNVNGCAAAQKAGAFNGTKRNYNNYNVGVGQSECSQVIADPSLQTLGQQKANQAVRQGTQQTIRQSGVPSRHQGIVNQIIPKF